jgi:sulfur carrier protein ThiS
VARVVFTKNLRRHLETPSVEIRGGTVREILDALFLENPQLRGYILDDQGSLRQHVVVFVDGERVADRLGLAHVVNEASEVYVMQALTGG